MKNKKIKITFFVPRFERLLVYLLKNIDLEKFEVSLLLGNRKGMFIDEIPEDIKVISLNVSHIRHSIIGLIKYFKKEKPDIFISFLSHANLVSIISKILSGAKTKIVISERSTFSKLSEQSAGNIYDKLIGQFIFFFLVKIFYPRADRIICVSKAAAEDLSDVIGKNKKIVFIYNGFDFKKIIELSKEKIDYPEFYSDNLPIICAVGRLVKAKDYPTLLNAFSILFKKVKSQLIIVGDGEDMDKLKAIAQRLDVSKSVYFAGFQKNPYKYMAKADVFVLSSITEGLPNVIVEAMACGTPVVSTDCKSGPNEIIEDGRNGFLVPIGDYHALAEKMLELINNTDLREKISEEGRMTAQNFSIGKSIKEYENLFKEVLK